MIDPGLVGKVALVTGGNNPFGIGAAIARSFASHGAKVFIHFLRQAVDPPGQEQDPGQRQDPGLPFFMEVRSFSRGLHRK